MNHVGRIWSKFKFILLSCAFVLSACSPFANESLVSLTGLAPKMKFDSSLQSLNFKTSTTIEIELEDAEGVIGVDYQFADIGQLSTSSVNIGLSATWQPALLVGRKVTVQTPAVDISTVVLQLRLKYSKENVVLNSPQLEIDGTPPTAPAVNLVSLPLTNSSNFVTQVTDCTDTIDIYKSTANVVPAVDDVAWQACTVGQTLTDSISGDGSHDLFFWAKDKAGNISLLATNLQVVLDTTAPTLSSSSFVADEILFGGATKSIIWSASDLHLGLLPISMELSLDDGANWSVLSPVTSNTGIYSWSVPAVDSQQMRVRVKAEDLLGNTSYAVSNKFIVDSLAPTITLSSPNGGEVFKAGDSQTISWSSSDTNILTNSAVIEYSINGGTNWISVVTGQPTTGSYSWTLPNVDSTQVLVRVSVSDQAGHTTSDISNGVFTIDYTAPVLSLTSLNGGDVLVAGQNYNITWTLSDNIALRNLPVGLEYSQDSGSHWTTIVGSMANTGTYSWTTPNFDLNTIRVRVWGFDVAGNYSYAMSTSDFSIDNSAPVVSITNPSGGEMYRGGSSQSVSWTTTGDHLVASSALVEIFNGTSWSTLASSQNTSGSHFYTVPSVDTTLASLRVSVSDLAGRVVTQTMASPFTIDNTAPSLSIAAPVAGSTLKGGASTDILWTASDTHLTAAPIMIEYTLDGGSSWVTLESAMANTGTLTTTVPVTDTAIAQVRIAATDQVGHVTTQTVGHFTVDSTAPASISISGIVAGPTNVATNRTVSVSGSTVSHYKGFLKFGNTCAGELANVQAQTEIAVASTHSVALSSGDGNYIYCALGRDAVGNEQTFVTASPVIALDTVAPPLTITSPAANFKAKTKVLLEGVCETGLPVNVSGTGILSPINLTCTAGLYSSDIFFSAGDGTKVITVQQTDAASNVTTVTRNFIRDNVAPALAQTTLSNPYYSSTNSVTWGGTCEANLPLSLTLAAGDSANFNCLSGAWSYTTNTQVTDNSRTYVLTHTDEAGNSSSINMVWVRDTVAPLLVFTTPASITNTLSNATFQGQCDGAGPITITGAQTTSVTCSAGNWTFTSAPFVVDDTYTFNFQVQDLAGNTTQIVGTWTRDTSVPALTISGSTQRLDQNNSVTWAGGCQADIDDVFITQPVVTTVPCTAGAWTYTYNNAVDGDNNFSFYQENTVGTRTTVTALWTRDTLAPEFQDNFFDINIGAIQTTLRYVKVDLKVIDATSRVNGICLKADDSTTPTADAGCWSSAFTANKTVTLSQFDMGLGLADKNYTLYAWARDEAGNVSALTNAGAGTANKDSKSILLNAGLPPSVTVVAAGVNNPQTPILPSESAVPAGSQVYINWKISDDRTLPAQYLNLEFATDSSGNYDEVASNLTSQAYNGCTVQPGYNGCYRWTSPTNGFLKFRAKATDSDQQVAFGLSSPLNIGQVRLLAGKTDAGTDQSALVNKFQPFLNDLYSPDAFSFVVTRDGVIYVRDLTRGVLKIDPVDGIARVFIPKTGSSNGDNGPVANATVNQPTRLLLDKSQPKQKLYIFDYDRIRVVDLNTNIITRVLGGGSTHASNTLAIDFAMNPQDPTSNWGPVAMSNATFMVTPNGDIFFQERYHRYGRKSTEFGQAVDDGGVLWWYKKADNRVYKYAASGTGVFLDNQMPQVYRAGQDISQCVQLTFWPDVQADGSFSRIGMVTHTTSEENSDPAMLNCRVSGRERWRWQDTPHFGDLNGVKIDDYWSSTGMHYNGNGYYKLYHHEQPLLGLDNKVYMISAHRDSSGQGLYQYDRNTKSFDMILGTGYRGRCADGTQALSCADKIDAAFINETGQVYFMNRGLIRTLKSDGTVVTIAGATTADIDGPALDTFIGSVLHFHIRDNGLILYADQADYQFREVDPAKSVKTIVDGSFNWAHDSGSRFAMDPVTGDFFHHNGGWQVAKYTRSSSAFGASGSWSPFIAGNGTLGWDDPAANGSSDIDLIANGSSNVGPGAPWTSWGAWIPPYPLLYDGSNLLVWISKAVSQQDVNGTTVVHNQPYRSSLLSFDVNTKVMHRMAGRLDAIGYDVMETGPAADQLQILASEWGHRMLGPYFDPTSSPRRYFTSRADWNNIYEIIDGGGTRILTTTTNDRVHGMAYRKVAGEDIIYYCGINNGQLYKRNVNTGVETQLPYNVPNMRCSGYGMQWSNHSQAIVFAYSLDGYNGIAEIIDP